MKLWAVGSAKGALRGSSNDDRINDVAGRRPVGGEPRDSQGAWRQFLLLVFAVFRDDHVPKRCRLSRHRKACERKARPNLEQSKPERRHWRHLIGFSIGRSMLSTPWAAF